MLDDRAQKRGIVGGDDDCPRGRVRIIMLTALAEWNDKQSALQTGADDYITKPIDLADLELRVRRNLALVTPHA